MSFVLLGTLATNCVGEVYTGALLAAPFLYNAYGQNLYLREFNWWFRLLTFLLIFGCNGTGLYGILKFKTSICKVTAYISTCVWFFVLVLMLLGSRNASIVAMRNRMGTAALESNDLNCTTSWSGICYILGLCILLNSQAAAGYFMMTLELLPIDIDALEEEIEGEVRSSAQGTAVTTTSPFRHSQKETAYEATKASGEDESMTELKRMPRRLILPETDMLEDLPHPHFPAPLYINSLTVKNFQPKQPKF